MIQQEILVAINCLTYNHEPYIRQCLEGFVTQKTKFRFVAIVHDDASTDNTAKIVREYADKYPDIIKPIFETVNQYSKKDGSLDKIINQAINETNCKYIAVCEGDDYWTDPFKLQKQVDILDRYPDYGMAYGRVRNYIHKENRFLAKISGDKESFNTLLLHNRIPTMTVLIRRKHYLKYLEEVQPFSISNGWQKGDYPLWLFISHYSKIYFSTDIYGVYRILEASASHFTDIVKRYEFSLDSAQIALFMCEKYCIRSKRAIVRLIWDQFMLYIYSKDNETFQNLKNSLHIYKNVLSLKILIVKIFLYYPESANKILSAYRHLRYNK